MPLCGQLVKEGQPVRDLTQEQFREPEAKVATDMF